MTQETKSFTLFSFIFTVFGLIIVLSGLGMLFSHITSANDYASTEAVIKKIEHSTDSDDDDDSIPYVYVNYSVNGKSYDATLNYWYSSMAEGGTVTVHYKISDPSTLRNTSYFLIILCLILGSISTAVGLLPILNQFGNKGLMTTGMLVIATINNITLNTSVSMNNSHPYKINFTFHNPIDGQNYTFTSKNIWADLSKKITAKEINVYINPQKPNKYYINIESFLKRP